MAVEDKPILRRQDKEAPAFLGPRCYWQGAGATRTKNQFISSIFPRCNAWPLECRPIPCAFACCCWSFQGAADVCACPPPICKHAWPKFRATVDGHLPCSSADSLRDTLILCSSHLLLFVFPGLKYDLGDAARQSKQLASREPRNRTRDLVTWH